MAAFTKYNSFVDEVSQGNHNLQTATLKVALTNTAPTASDTVWNTTVYPAPANANGYPSGGNTLSTSSAATTSGTFKLVLADSTFTASGGTLGPFQYAVIYNSSASNKVVGYYDRGSSLTMNDTDTFKLDLDQINGALTLA